LHDCFIVLDVKHKLVSLLVTCGLFGFSGEGFDSTDIREGFLGHSRDMSLPFLDCLLCALHKAAEEASKNDHRDDAAKHQEGQLPRDHEEKDESGYDKDERAEEHGHISRESLGNHSGIGA
jgi:hypothetical protein